MRKYFGLIVILLALFFPLKGSRATAVSTPHPLQQQPALGPTDPQEVETFLDAFLAREMAEKHIPGATFVLVKDGEIFLAKGYGLGDVAAQTPVDPEKTLFGVASVSKVFTATAVMQLVERGLLDLDGDVNQTLTRFQVESDASQPVTVANLLTHTGGFDERILGMGARTLAEVASLGDYLAAHMPPCVLPPGDQISYSNHGYALAGYLVEVTNGVPFAQYVAENIFQPLGMAHSTFAQPLPPDLAAHLAVSYRYTGGSYQPNPPLYSRIPPAGALHMTATDMARFMIAHLEDGRFGDSRILKTETAQMMHQRQFSHHPRLPGWTYGFHEYVANGQRALMHSGGDFRYTALLFLLPAQNLGFFLAYNANQNPEALITPFLDHYYPSPAPAGAPALRTEAAGGQDLQRFAGSYRPNQFARTTLEKGILPVWLFQIGVQANEDGTLTITQPPDATGNRTRDRWQPAGPLLFYNAAQDAYIAFREDGNGRITHLFLTAVAPRAFEKAPWYGTTGFQLGLLAFMTLLFLSMLLVSVGSGLRQRWRQLRSPASVPAQARHMRLARALAGLVSLLNLIFLGGLAATIIWAFSGNLLLDPPGSFIVLLVVPLLTAVLTIALLVFTVLAWRHRDWSLLGRLHYTGVALAALCFTWFAHNWNLLGFVR